MSWIIKVTIVLLCPNSVWPTAVWFILTLDTKLRSLSWHDLCITGMVLLTKEGIIFYWTVESRMLLSTVVWIATVFGKLSSEKYSLFYRYRTLADQACGFQKRYTAWCTFTGILYQSVFLHCDSHFYLSISLDSSKYKVFVPYWCLQISFMWCIFALIHDFWRETSPPSLQNRSAY